MKLLRMELHNFASYEHLTYEFSADGATVISGPTGAGKSTFMDAVPWILFSRTAKDGAADDVLSWNAKEATRGVLDIELKNGRILQIQRIRGKGENDLWYIYVDTKESLKRGKDLKDTQQIINNLLGFDCDLYLSGAYFHEFSQAASFFVANAKTRRSIIEQVVDLTFAKDINEKAIEHKSQYVKLLDETKTDLIKAQSALEQLKKTQEANKIKALQWQMHKNEQIFKIQRLICDFDSTKAKEIKALTQEFEVSYASLHKEIPFVQEDTIFANKLNELVNNNLVSDKNEMCITCGATKQKDFTHDKKWHALEMERQSNRQLSIVKTSLERQLDKMTKVYSKALETETNRSNAHIVQLQTLKSTANPYENQSSDLNVLEQEIKTLQNELNLLKDEITNTDTLKTIISQFRTILTTNAVSELERRTNDTLNDYFDAEIRVKFEIEQADKLEVTILKDGHECAYHQLSKGQRQLLKLSYGIATMQAIQNHHGIVFSTIFLDEPCDGLDSNLKEKALKLFNALVVIYDNVFVVEHADAVKMMSNHKIEVRLENGVSKLEQS